MFRHWAPSSLGLGSVWYSCRSWCVDSSLTCQYLFTFISRVTLLTPICMSHRYFWFNENISHFYIDYRMYSASALSANTAIRSAVAAAFPLFTVQLFTNVSQWSGSFFSSSSPILIIFGHRIVGCKLGMHFDWLHRAPILAISLFILQIWSQNTSA